MPHFYHYTDEEGAQNIIRCGKVMVSLGFMASGDAAYGNGVYLTKLNPTTSTKEDIARNNWMNTSAQFINKTKNYFVFDIPDSGVEGKTERGRNIFLFRKRNDLLLTKYPWWLRNFDTGRVIASYKYQVSSLGPAFSASSDKMGNYIFTEDSVNGRPVYKGDSAFLFVSTKGNWLVGPEAGVNTGYFRQKGSNFSLGPDPNLPWEFGVQGGQFSADDDTLKVCAWQM